MKFFPLICYFLFLSITSIAQESKGIKIRNFYHSHGISFQKFGNLNKRIAVFPQFEQPKNSTGIFEFGLITERNKLLTGFNINAGSSLSGTRNIKSTATNFWGLAANAGYNLLNSSRVSLFPYTGLGYEKYKVIFNRDVSNVPFDSVLQSGNVQQRVENIVFTNSFIIYKAGIGFSVKSKKHKQNSIGLLLDYSGSFKANDWKINKLQTLSNSPKDNLSKIAASILIRYQFKQKK